MTRPPTSREREIVADVMTSAYSMVGSVADMWNHPYAPKLHATLRHALLAIFELVRAGRAVGPSRVRATIQANLPADASPEGMDEVINHLMTDGKARTWWDDMMPDRSYPHVCPRCGLAAFIGFQFVECKTEGCE